jgi:hypothetical protein
LEKITCERNQPGKFVTGVNVLLDDVKREIVKPAAAPDRHCEQPGRLPSWVVEKNQQCSGQADEEKQAAFQFDPKWIRQFFHGGIVASLTAGGNAESFGEKLIVVVQLGFVPSPPAGERGRVRGRLTDTNASEPDSLPPHLNPLPRGGEEAGYTLDSKPALEKIQNQPTIEPTSGLPGAKNSAS